jgi:signal transduction histidine kinase
MLLSLFSLLSKASAQYPVATKGVIDLQKWDFEKSGAVKLDGEWEFYWNRLISPGQFYGQYPDCYINQPISWHGCKIKNTTLPAFGIATYRLKVILSEKQLVKFQSLLAITLIEAHTASCAWVNGKPIIKNGIVDSSNKFKPAVKPQVAFFDTKSDTIEIVIQVANFFDTRQAGIDDNVLLDTQEGQIKAFHNKIFLFLGSFGVLFFIGFYHLFLWLIRKEQKINLHFAILCITLSLFSIWVGDKMIYYLLPHLPLKLYYRIWFAFLAVVPLFVVYIHDLYPNYISNKTLKINFSVFIVYLLMVFLSPSEFYIRGVVPFLIISLGYCVYILYILFKAYWHKLPFSGWFALGMSIAILTGVNDILFALDWIVTGYYMPIGFMACILIHSFIISIGFSKSYSDAITLRHELQKANEELENQVTQRTSQLDKANKELNETIQAKDKLLAILSHDLKNPLFSVKLIIDQIMRNKNKINEKSMITYLELIQGSIVESNRILENINLWSQIQTGKIKSNPSFFNIYELVSTIISLVKPAAEQKQIEIKINVSPDIEIFTDKDLLHVIIRNLVSNAIKFTSHGGKIIVTVKASNFSVFINIEDTGIGIPPEKVGLLFHSENRYHTSGTSKEKGSGLGLLICQEFMTILHGTITVESEIDKGSSFTVTLPYKQ